MIQQSVKSLPKTDARNEISTDKKKRPPTSASDGGCRISNSKVQSGSKFFSGCSSLRAHEFSLQMACERRKLRMKFLESKNADEKTSEGIQEFINRVSAFIEKKNPFKDKTCTSCDRDSVTSRKKNAPFLVNQRPKPSSLERLSEMILAETRKSFRERQKEGKKISLPKSAKNSKEVNPIRQTNKGTRKSEIHNKQASKETSQDTKTVSEELQTEKRAQQSAVGREKQNANSPQNIADSGERGRRGRMGNVFKKEKPSEIPLRKKKTVLNRTPNTVPRSVQDPMDCYEVPEIEKTLSSLEELSLSSELQLALSVDDDFEKQSSIDEEKATATVNNQTPEAETESDKKVETFFKSSDVSAVCSNELLENNPSGGKKIRIDLRKTSTFLQNEGVLDRLESLHKQNLNSKTKVKTLKGKQSNSSRTALKTKTKRSKRELNTMKKEKTIREYLDSGRAWWESRKTVYVTKKGRTKEVGVSRAPIKLVRTKAKSLLKGIEVQKEIEKPVTTVDDFQKTERPKPENPTADKPSEEIHGVEENKCEGMGDSKTKEEVLVFPLPIPEQTGIPTNCIGAEDGVWPPPNTDMIGEKLKLNDSPWTNGPAETINTVTAVNKPLEAMAVVGHELNKLESITSNSMGSCGNDFPKPPEHLHIERAIKRIKTDFKSVENIRQCNTTEKSAENAESFDWLFKKDKNYGEAPCEVIQTSSSESRRTVGENVRNRLDVVADSFSSELGEEPGPLNIHKPQRSCSSIKRRRGEKGLMCKSTEGATKTSRKKKIRPDTGGRRLPSPNGFFNSEITLLNKVTRERSGLVSSHVRGQKKDIFEEAAAAKLKRRNSEPCCLRGYIWKCTDAATPRGHKPSVSSMASSLRHLNTDDFDDFIFWEAIPQRKTAWEASLYHFKRPWSLLSCSIFKDNRRSSAPGVILENLRNGGPRRFGAIENERLRCRKENPFDVEPSIAQKNIDIKNWLAALNFQIIPSTSSDFLSESNFGTQSTSEPQNRNKIQTFSRRRKIGSNLKFSEEPGENRCEAKEKPRKSSRWSGSETESLTELTRRKSGGFVTKEQYLNSEHPIRRPNPALNLCVYSKSAEESLLTETTDRSSGTEPRKFKSMEVGLQPQATTSATIAVESPPGGDQVIEKCIFEEPSEVEIKGGTTLTSFLKRELRRLISGLRIWKYVFMFTVLVVAAHYFFLCCKF